MRIWNENRDKIEYFIWLGVCRANPSTQTHTHAELIVFVKTLAVIYCDLLVIYDLLVRRTFTRAIDQEASNLICDGFSVFFLFVYLLFGVLCGYRGMLHLVITLSPGVTYNT